MISSPRHQEGSQGGNSPRSGVPLLEGTFLIVHILHSRVCVLSETNSHIRPIHQIYGGYCTGRRSWGFLPPEADWAGESGARSIKTEPDDRSWSRRWEESRLPIGGRELAFHALLNYTILDYFLLDIYLVSSRAILDEVSGRKRRNGFFFKHTNRSMR